MPSALETTEMVKVPASALSSSIPEGSTAIRDFSTLMSVASTSSRVLPYMVRGPWTVMTSPGSMPKELQPPAASLGYWPIPLNRP